jgi:hypothetical protein
MKSSATVGLHTSSTDLRIHLLPGWLQLRTYNACAVSACWCEPLQLRVSLLQQPHWQVSHVRDTNKNKIELFLFCF